MAKRLTVDEAVKALFGAFKQGVRAYYLGETSFCTTCGAPEGWCSPECEVRTRAMDGDDEPPDYPPRRKVTT